MSFTVKSQEEEDEREFKCKPRKKKKVLLGQGRRESREEEEEEGKLNRDAAGEKAGRCSAQQPDTYPDTFALFVAAAEWKSSNVLAAQTIKSSSSCCFRPPKLSSFFF